MADKKRFLLRLDEETYRSIRRWADDDFRSVNAQIEMVLRKALKENGRLQGSRQSSKDV